MEDAASVEDDERSIELSSVAAIYPEIKIDPKYPFTASLELPVTPSPPLKVLFEQSAVPRPVLLTPPTSLDTAEGDLPLDSVPGAVNGGAADIGPDVHSLSHLPPLILDIELPDGYPSSQPPIFRLSTNPPWLPSTHITQLTQDGRRLWEESGKDMVVYTYIDHLQQSAEDPFNLTQSDDREVKLPRNLKIALLDYDNKTQRERFEQETFECGVCLEPKKGAKCHRMLLCSHVFCIPCLQDFYNTCVKEGDVDNVKCLAPDCGKEPKSPGHDDNVTASSSTTPKKRKKRDRTLNPSELLQIPLEQETVQRYVFLKRKKKLESDKSTIYCPRQWCQGAARSKKHPKPTDPISDDIGDSDEEEEQVAFDPLGDEAQLPAMADRVAICEDCGYAFCSVCKKGWHGELVRCFPRREAELSAEEKATEEYLKLYTTPCPTCDAPCQKRMGCNHMICFKCGTHFCYLCSSWLAEDNPYRHFNTLDSSCFNRLWDLEGGDGVNPDGAEALHQVPAELRDFEEEPSDSENGDHEESESDDDDPNDGIALDHPVIEFRADSDGSDEDSDSDSSDDEVDARQRRRPPPPAPVPPRVIPPIGHPGHRNRGGRGGVGGGGRGGAHPHPLLGLDAAGRAAAAEREAQARAMAEIRDRNRPLPAAANGAPQRDHRRVGPGPARQPGHGHGHVRQEGLQRFLELVQNDQEDEWDSDELDDL